MRILLSVTMMEIIILRTIIEMLRTLKMTVLMMVVQIYFASNFTLDNEDLNRKFSDELYDF